MRANYFVDLSSYAMLLFLISYYAILHTITQQLYLGLDQKSYGRQVPASLQSADLRLVKLGLDS